MSDKEQIGEIFMTNEQTGTNPVIRLRVMEYKKEKPRLKYRDAIKLFLRGDL